VSTFDEQNWASFSERDHVLRMNPTRSGSAREEGTEHVIGDMDGVGQAEDVAVEFGMVGKVRLRVFAGRRGK